MDLPEFEGKSIIFVALLFINAHCWKFLSITVSKRVLSLPNHCSKSDTITNLKSYCFAKLPFTATISGIVELFKKGPDTTDWQYQWTGIGGVP